MTFSAEKDLFCTSEELQSSMRHTISINVRVFSSVVPKCKFNTPMRTEWFGLSCHTSVVCLLYHNVLQLGFSRRFLFFTDV